MVGSPTTPRAVPLASARTIGKALSGAAKRKNAQARANKRQRWLEEKLASRRAGEAEELAARSAAEAEERRHEAEELEEEREARARSKRAMRRIVRRLRCMHRLAAHAAAIGPSAVEDLTLDQLSAIWRR